MTIPMLIAVLMAVSLSNPAHSQQLAFSDLEGMSVEADIHLDQVLMRDGRSAAFKLHYNWKISLESDNAIKSTMVSTVHGPRGTRKADPLSGTLALGKSRDVKSLGGGEALWTFEDGTLTYVRTLQAGAYRAQFAFKRESAGLSCTATGAFAREQGSGPIRFETSFGFPVTVISSKQVSSTCRVAKQ